MSQAGADDPEVLRQRALSEAAPQEQRQRSKRYAERCMQAFATELPLLWPRRTSGAALRVAYLLAPGRSILIGGVAIDVDAYLAHVVGAHPRERFAPIVFLVDAAAVDSTSLAAAGIPTLRLRPSPDPSLARSLAEGDYDALIDLAGMAAPTGALLARRTARTIWTYPHLAGAHVAPLITHALPEPDAADASALAAHRIALEAALVDACTNASWFVEHAGLTAETMAKAWRSAVTAHRAGDAQGAIAAYRRVLDEEPGYAPGHYLLGLLLRDQGKAREAEAELERALLAAPGYADARSALANLQCSDGRAASAASLSREGLALAPTAVSLWRALGMAELASRDADAASEAFERALALDPSDATTQYNRGVALQMLRRDDAALRAYERALGLDRGQIGAEFNMGVIFQGSGRSDAAIEAFERVIARDPAHVPAHKALGETLLAARRIDDWLRAFDRFEAHCPRSLALAVPALRACQYRADFTGLDRYLERLLHNDFAPESEADLADCLEQLLYLLLYFDIAPETHLAFYRDYDAVARQVYGVPLPRRAGRRPGRIRLGYLSGDLRNHVMGKMMWEAVRHHDRERFELNFYSTVDESDEWTELYRGLADRYRVLANVPDREAALRIAADDLDLLVDLSTHTKGARPGILALKPAAVQITHVASSGAVGLSAIDFKLTDACADLPEYQAHYLETLLPMAGCVYPYRHVEPAPEHPFHRGTLGVPADAVVLGAFFNPMKLSRRSLAMWRAVLERVPRAILAISPQAPELRPVYARLLSTAGIPPARVLMLPQGRDDAENQARYHLIDLVVDALPYAGVNGTLEALDAGVPVVTLRGRRHSERTSCSILTNLGVAETIANSDGECVDIAVRLATDSAFAASIRAAISAGIAHSPLTDMRGHTRNLERAYVDALRRRHPEALTDRAHA